MQFCYVSRQIIPVTVCIVACVKSCPQKCCRQSPIFPCRTVRWTSGPRIDFDVDPTQILKRLLWHRKKKKNCWRFVLVVLVPGVVIQSFELISLTIERRNVVYKSDRKKNPTDDGRVSGEKPRDEYFFFIGIENWALCLICEKRMWPASTSTHLMWPNGRGIIGVIDVAFKSKTSVLDFELEDERCFIRIGVLLI